MTVPAGLSDSVGRVLAGKGWHLVDDMDAFVQRVHAEILARAGTDPKESASDRIVNATTNQYCTVLHKACGEDGSRRQRRAFGELWPRLMQVAAHRSNGDQQKAEDCAQEAQIKIRDKLDECRNPGAFFEWCNTIVYRTWIDLGRKGSRQVQVNGKKRLERREVAMTDLMHDEELPEREVRGVVSEGITVEQSVGRSLIERWLLPILKANLTPDEFRVIVDAFLDVKSDFEIAQELKITVNHVHVLRFRAKAHLRDCSDLVYLYEESLL